MIEKYVWQLGSYWIQEKRDKMNGEEIENNTKEKVYITDDMLVSNKIEKDFDKINIEEDIDFFPLVTIVLIILNVLIYIWEINTGALTTRETIIGSGALYKEGIAKGEYWRMFSCMFLHGSFTHIFSNMVMLYLMGIMFERFFTKTKSISIYILSGLIGSFLSMSFSEGPSVGASGAIFGLMGANVYYILRNKQMLTEINKRIGTVLLVVSLISIVEGVFIPHIDYNAHIGGFMGGLLFAITFGGENVINMRYNVRKKIR